MLASGKIYLKKREGSLGQRGRVVATRDETGRGPVL